MGRTDKPLVWLHGEVRSPPLSTAARLEVGLDPDAVVILEVFSKKTTATPKPVIEAAQLRLRMYDAVTKEQRGG